MPSSFTPPPLATPVSIANGGTGSATAALARIALGVSRLSAVLASDFTVTNSATYVTPTGMSVSLEAGTWLLFYYGVFNDTDNIQGHKTQLDFGGVSAVNFVIGAGGNSGVTTTSIISMPFPWPGANTVSPSAGFGAGYQFGGAWAFNVATFASAATVSLQMAQSTATPATSAVMKAGSALVAIRVG